MSPEDKAKLAVNMGAAWKMWSNWVMTASGALGAIWLALPVEQQQAVIAHLPLPPWILPIVGTVIGVTLRIWPQASITQAEAAAKSAQPQAAEKEVL